MATTASDIYTYHHMTRPLVTGRRLKRRRTYKGMTPKQASQRTRVTPSFYAALERGRRPIPNWFIERLRAG